MVQGDELLLVFLSKAAEDARIGTAHISLYVTLWKRWMDSGSDGPLSFFRKDVAEPAKISSANTFHRVLRDLHSFGYLRYVPSYNHFLGSMVWFGEGQYLRIESINVADVRQNNFYADD